MSSPNRYNPGDDSARRKKRKCRSQPKRSQETIFCSCTAPLNGKHNNKPLEVRQGCLGSLGPSHMPAQHISSTRIHAQQRMWPCPQRNALTRLHEGVTKCFVRDMYCFNQSFPNGCIPFFAPIKRDGVQEPLSSSWTFLFANSSLKAVPPHPLHLEP